MAVAAVQPPPPPVSSPDGHLAEQAAIADSAARAAAAALSTLDPHDLAGSRARFRTVLEALVRSYGRRAAVAALAWYRRHRLAEGAPGSTPSLPVPEADTSRLDAAVGWIVQPLYGPQPDVATARDRAASAVEQAVLDTGRQAVIGAAKKDGYARGWVRVPEPGACAFCLMLATRGPAYKSKRGANFQAHDNCRCNVAPVFGKWQPSPLVRDATQRWREVTKGVPTGQKLNVFRQSLDGRPIRVRATKPRPVSGPSRRRAMAPAVAERLRESIRRMEAGNRSGRYDAAIAAARARLHDLAA